MEYYDFHPGTIWDDLYDIFEGLGRLIARALGLDE